MHNFQFERFFDICKVDDEKRMVYGYASTKDMDSDGEVVELNALKNALPSYMQYPALREMHKPDAAGTTKSAEIDKKGLYVGSEVVDDSAWKKVKKGVYKGFSIGGNVTERVGNIIKGLELVEISLVDVPANKAARIDLWKRDFSDAQRKDLASSGKALPDGSFPIVSVQDLKNAIHAIGRAKDPAKAKAHIKSRAKALGREDLLPDDWKKAATTTIQKNADGVNHLAGLMSHVKMVRDMHAAQGKNTDELDKTLESVKGMIADEADETEEDANMNRPIRDVNGSGAYNITGPAGDLQLSQMPKADLLKLKIERLEKMDFGDNLVAEVLRKGSIIDMKNQLKKADGQVVEQTEEEKAAAAKAEAEKAETEAQAKLDAETETKVEETAEVKDETATEGQETETKEETQETTEQTETTETEAKAEETATAEETASEEAKEAAALANTLKKVGDAGKALEKMSPAKVEKKDMSLVKAVNTMGTTIAKMAEVIQGLEDRLAKVEKTPAAPKSKSTLVFKGEEDKAERTKKIADPNSELGIKKARLTELNKKYDELGAAEFAKAGLSIEASSLINEVAKLEATQEK